MPTPAPVAVPPQTPRRIDPDDEFRDRPAALIKMELEARRDDIKHHLEGLKNEFSSARGLSSGGRPLPEALAKKGLQIAGGALAVGLALGLLSGARKRRRSIGEISDLDIVRAHAASLVDEAARRVARGLNPDEAIARTVRSHPVLIADTRTPAERRGPGTWSVVKNTLVGVGLKIAADQLTQRLTPHEEAIEALKDAAD